MKTFLIFASCLIPAFIFMQTECGSVEQNPPSLKDTKAAAGQDAQPAKAPKAPADLKAPADPKTAQSTKDSKPATATSPDPKAGKPKTKKIAAEIDGEIIEIEKPDEPDPEPKKKEAGGQQPAAPGKEDAGQAVPPDGKQQEQPKQKTEVDINTEEIAKLKEEYVKEKEQLSGPKKEKLSAIIKKYIEEADSAYEQKKKSGNVKGLAVAREAKAIFTDLLDQVAKTASFKLPEKYRADLNDTMDKFKAEAEAVSAEFDKVLPDLEAKTLEKFKELIKPQLDELRLKGEKAEEAVRAKYDEFQKNEIKPPAKEPTIPEEADAQGGEKVSPIIASSGNAAKWIDVGIWTAEMAGMDVVNIKINVKASYSEAQQSPVGGDSTWNYFMIFPVPPRSDYVFQLGRLPGKYAPDVIEWPTISNSMELIIRTKPLAQSPAPYGFIIRASLPDKDIYKIFNKNEIGKRTKDAMAAMTAQAAKAAVAKAVGDEGAAAAPDGGGAAAPGAEDQQPAVGEASVKTFTVEFTSKPDGAMIYIDDDLQIQPSKAPFTTPCSIAVKEGRRSVKFVKFGFQDKIQPLLVDKNTKMHADLALNPKCKRFSLPANQTGWKATGFTVKSGEYFMISANGKWSCSERKELCSADGYPNNKEFFKFYVDSSKDVRQEKTALYGALLIRIGRAGMIFPYSSEKAEYRAYADGEINLDINEMINEKERKNNSGSIEIIIGPSTNPESQPQPAGK